MQSGMSERIVYVVKDDCTSCRACADGLPRYFQMDADDLAESHKNGGMINAAVIPEEDQELVQQEMDDCPGECIHWKKD